MRGWEKFHTPKNLAMALSVEVSEIVELFQWSEDPWKPHSDPAPELADTFIYLIRLADVLGIDLLDAAYEKIVANEKRFPISGHYGIASSRRGPLTENTGDTEQPTDG